MSPPGAFDEIRISNAATYWPLAPMDVVVGAPLAIRLLLGVTPIGRVVQAAALGAYLGSAYRDWRDRQGVRKIDFRGEFGADLHHMRPMPREAREADVRRLVVRLNDEFVPASISRRELAVEVDRHLTRYIAGITGQRVLTSVEVRGFALAKYAFPSALGMCDILSGDVALFKDTGCFEPHIIAHEFCHRKGYWKELYAQVLAYLALVDCGEPILEQSARLERAYRHLRVLTRDDDAAFHRRVVRAGFRPELESALSQLRMPAGAASRRMTAAMRALYDARMRLTGQNGLSDYDLGFTNFLYTFETSVGARQKARPD